MGTGSYFHSWSAAPVTLTNKLTVKLPVVLIHAFCDVPELTGTLKLAERSLRDMGVEYFSTAIPIHRTGGTIATRTRELVSQIQEKYHNRQIHLFGHSMVRLLIAYIRIEHCTDLYPGWAECSGYRS